MMMYSTSDRARTATRFNHGASITRSAGVTLVELMIAMALGLAIVAAVGYIYVSGVQGFRVQDAQSRSQEDARFVIETISRDIRMAGYFGCNRPRPPLGGEAPIEVLAAQPLMTDDTSWLSGDTQAYDRFVDQQYMMRAFSPTTAATHPAMPAYVQSTAPLSGRKPGNDVLMVLRGGEDAQRFIPPDDTADDVTFSMPNRLSDANDNPILAITDCVTTKIIKPSVQKPLKVGDPWKLSIANTLNKNQNTPGDTEQMNKHFGPDAVVMSFKPVLYYVAQPTASAKSVPSLRRVEIEDGTPIKPGIWHKTGGITVASGVDNLQFSYVLDGSPAQQVADTTAMEALGSDAWSRVTAVRVQFTMLSPDKNTDIAGGQLKSQPYSFVVSIRGRQYTGVQ
jgi:type IV pilus assembly protein PilW